jgi:drug/metabolite transporter (DMT)-like permease
MYSALLLTIVVALMVYGQLIIKVQALIHSTAERYQNQSQYLFAMLTDIWVLSGLAAGFVGGLGWMLVIRRLEIGYAYPFLALVFVFVPLGSNIFLKEPLPPTQLLGLALIVTGISISAIAR